MSKGADVASALRALRLFNEKADKLKELSFTEWVTSNPTRFSLEFKGGGGLMGKRSGPDAESIDAFLLTLRFFVQNNEPSSFCNMAGTYEELGRGSLVSAPIVNAFIETRTTMNQWLDQALPVGFIGRQKADDKGFTRREVFEVILYGALAHATQSKKAQYEEWQQKYPYLLPYFEYTFANVLKEFLRVIDHMQHLNDRALAELQNHAPPA